MDPEYREDEYPLSIERALPGKVDTNYIIREKKGNILYITLNRPEKMNAWFVKDFLQFGRAIREAEQDDDVKVIVIKGKGGNFCAGHNLNEVGRLYGWKDAKHGESSKPPLLRTKLKTDRVWFEVYQQLFFCQKVTIAQVDGYAIASGFFMILMCDLAVASEDAQMGIVVQTMGGGGHSWVPHLVLQIGLKKMRELQLIGNKVSGKEAAELGIVNKAVPHDQLESTVNKWAEAISLQPADSIAVGKAFNHIAYERLGLAATFPISYTGHTMMTCQHFTPEEFNFFKERRDIGTRDAFHLRDKRIADKLK